MSYKLWFISENSDPIGVFENFNQANDEFYFLKENNPKLNYNLYSLGIIELEKYTNELNLAEAKGLLIK